MYYLVYTHQGVDNWIGIECVIHKCQSLKHILQKYMKVMHIYMYTLL